MDPILFIVFLPLLAAAIAGLGNRALGNTLAKSITTGALFISCALSWPIFLSFVGGHAEPHVVQVLHWVQSGSLTFDWALRVDTLTAIMLVVITSVSALVHLYSWGYMAEDPDQPRFFAYLSLFTFAMLMLVTANNLVQMFFGWEGVGLASYLLIGFWFRKPSASAAAIKAFVVNRVGDLGFMLGIFGTFLVFNTVSIPEILVRAPGMAGSTIGFLGYRWDTMTILCILLFIGAMGKSAQLPFSGWLPRAMEGPTPSSALFYGAVSIHAGLWTSAALGKPAEDTPILRQRLERGLRPRALGDHRRGAAQRVAHRLQLVDALRRLAAADALVDPLTRLHNRRGLDAELGELALAAWTAVGVLAIDIDKFKSINDGHGHDAGDRVLVAVANAARDTVAVLGVASVIARTGGEEFVVVVRAEPSTVRRLADLLHEAVARLETAVVPTISIGLVTSTGAPDGIRDLIECADTAMYAAKNSGGGQTVLFAGRP